VRIKDLGAGISPEEQEQLFTKFFRGKDRGEDLIKGSGLGLYLSKYFIELHEGSIRVESSPGKGSEFIICLPITSA
jgi:signal transduction histidine kinase